LLPPHTFYASWIFLIEKREDLYLHFHQSISPLSEENLLDLDLRVLWEFPPLFFLSYIFIVFVDLVGFGREGFEYLCSCHCIGLSSPRRFIEVKVRSLLLLGFWNPRRLNGALVAILGATKLNCGDCPKLCGFVTLWCIGDNYGTSN
jgi:hypothetical protein